MEGVHYTPAAQQQSVDIPIAATYANHSTMKDYRLVYFLLVFR